MCVYVCVWTFSRGVSAYVCVGTKCDRVVKVKQRGVCQLSSYFKWSVYVRAVV